MSPLVVCWRSSQGKRKSLTLPVTPGCSEQEPGYLVGLSRQRVNEALQALQAAEFKRMECGGVRVFHLPGLRTYRSV
jgi:hypothetical protein